MKTNRSRITLVGALLCAAWATATAETFSHTPPEDQLRAMERLQHWVGVWQGGGWGMSGPGQRHEFEITETVIDKIAGSVLLIEGHGVVSPDGGNELTIHQSLGMLSYDPQQGRYNLRSHDLSGGVRDAEFEVDDDVMRWGFRDEQSGALLRFEITIDGNTWHETGQVSPNNDENWYPMLDMTLHRQEPADATE